MEEYPEEKEKRLAANLQRIQQLVQQNEEKQQEITRQLGEIEQLQKNITDLNKERLELKASWQQEQKNVELAEADALKTQVKLQKARMDLAKLSNTEAELLKKNATLEASQQRLEKEQQSLKTELASLRNNHMQTVSRSTNSKATSSLNGTSSSKPKAGDLWDKNPLGIKFRYCPAESFTMGSPKSEKYRSNDENQVRVTLTNGFWLGQHEVTQGLWEKVMSTTPWKGKSFVKEGANYAASYISYDDAMKFCEELTKLGHQEGWLPKDWKVTLPTEAQWEYACRAGTTTAYHFGNDASQLGDYAWYDENADDVGEDYAHEVGQKKPNAWNLYDMTGNVWEWCLDGYNSNLPGGVDPVVKSSSYRVIRGGGWFDFARSCRSADRYYYSPGYRYYCLGFRICIVPVQSH